MSNRLLTIDILSTMLSRSRSEQGKTQKHMARCLGKSIGTIQNWEGGYATPNLIDLMAWFEALGLNPMKYVLDFVYPDSFGNLSASDPTEDVRDCLVSYIQNSASDDEIRKIAFNIFGNTGSSWHAQLDMLTALNHLTMIHRVFVGQMIYDAYTLLSARDQLLYGSHIHPDINNLREAIEEGKKSVMRGNEGYI